MSLLLKIITAVLAIAYEIMKFDKIWNQVINL